MKKVSSVNEYILLKSNWQKELLVLRKILISADLEETIKWGAPAYCKNGKNIVGIGAFKSYVGLWFHQGALLADKHNKLINAQEDKTKALRQWRFSNLSDIEKSQKIILSYVKEAIKNHEAGKEIKPERNKKILLPSEFKNVLEKDEKLKNNFEKFSQGKKREFAEYIAEAKRDETKQKRIKKIIPLINNGVGLNDKYRKVK